MPVCAQKSGQASTESLVYKSTGAWVVCTEVFVATNNDVRIDWTSRPRYTALELMKLPREERRKILEQAADDALSEYQNDTSLTAFEAFGDTDLYDKTS